MQPTNEPASGPGTKLQPGCYLLAFKPSDPDAPIDYGSLRVEMVGDGFQASADLYHWEDGGPPVELVKPRAGVPVFPLANYRFYLRGEGRQLGPLETAGVQLNFGAFEYDARQKEVPLGAGPQFTALLHRNPAPPGYPEPHFLLSGPVVSRRGETVGTLTAGWVCSYLRKAEIELAATGRVPEPMANEAGLTWVEVFNVPEINWQLEVSQTRLAEPGPSPERVDGARPEQVEGPADPRGWTLAELHEAMMGVESEVPAADPPWRYTLLCVENILGDGFERGVMFDFGAFDLNETPREGAAIASGWTVPPDWGFGRDILFGTLKDAYLRTGIHEIGRASCRERVSFLV